MGGNFNFKNFGNDIPLADGDGGGTFSFPLTREPSVYSLTFDEFQTTIGGIGKEFGSMNMDEFLKNIWNAEENQNIGSISGGGGGGGQEVDTSLQRQGSLILPRTLSLKTVDQVWHDISKDFRGGATSMAGSVGEYGMSERQPTLGEITLEDFLMRAGAVREENRMDGNLNNSAFFNELAPHSNNLEFGFGYQNINGIGSLNNGRIAENNDQIVMNSANLPLNVNGVRSSAAYQQPLQAQQQQILPNQPTLAYAAPVVAPSNVQFSPEMRGGVTGITDRAMNNTMIKNMDLQGGGLGMLGLRANGFETGSPAVSSDGLTKNYGDTPSVSPVPYAFSGGLRGRKIAAVEKIVERRHRRMIKNRESAARSRARKQAYTMELEAEVAKLKEENEELDKKHTDMIEMQKKQAAEMMKRQKTCARQKNGGAERRCLRRTHTGPW